MPKHPDVHLTARTDIGPYRRGDHIEDHAEVDAILKGEHRAHFVRVTADNTPGDKAEIAAAKAESDKKAKADKAAKEAEAAKALNAPVEKPLTEVKA
jgi:hypothetical protein